MLQKAAARLLQVTEPPDGSERVSGHSLRPTGAQGLTRLGLSLWQVQLMGRWGSEAVKTYVRAAAADGVALSAASAARATHSGLGLDELVALVREKLSAGQPQGISVERSVVEAGVFPGAGQATLQTQPTLIMDAVDSASAAAERSQSVSGRGMNRATAAYDVVRNPATKFWHKVTRGPSTTPTISSWRTRCGWRFGEWPRTEIFPGSHLPPGWKPLCSRCFRELREERKVEARRCLEEQDGGTNQSVGPL